MSPRTVAEKLLITPDSRVWASERSMVSLLDPLPDVRLVGRIGDATVAVFFVDDEKSLRTQLDKHARTLDRPEALWIAYPKGNKADINRDTVWPIVAEHGMRPIGQVAIDETWSALRFRPLREGEEQFGGGRPSG